MQIDRNFKLEVVVIASAQNEGGEQRLLGAMFATLPTLTTARTPAEVLDMMGSILGGELYKFCNAGAQGQANTLRGLISAMRLGQRPQIIKDNSSFMQRCATRFAFFARVSVDWAEGEPKQLLTGAEAVSHMFAEAKKVTDAGEPYNLQTLSFGVYHWLLTDAQQAGLALWTTKLLNGLDHAPASSSPDYLPKKNERKKDAKAKQSKDALKQSVDDLFS